ncbi:AMP-binding protein [Micrococcales bacterium 31B]|nr:AMP-binding protein [Micrococcales bacterium 31B]
MTATTSAASLPWVASYQGVPAQLPTPQHSILEAFRAVVQDKPDTVIMRYFDTPLTAREIDDISNSVAVGLQQRGIEPGDRVAMYLQNVPAAMITLLSAWKAGAVVVPCNPMLKGRELVKILSNSGCRGIILHDDLYVDIAAAVLCETAVEFAITTSALDFLADGEVPGILSGMQRQSAEGAVELRDVIAENRGAEPATVVLTSDDVAFMVYTSGTTGAPKGAMNTHGNAYFAASVYREWMRLDDTSVILGLAPLFHVTGMTGHLVLSLITGAELLLFYRFDADTACRLTEKYRATFAVTAITAFTALLASPAITQYDMSSLKTVYTGGAPTPTTVIDQWSKVVGSEIHPMYGLTEVTSPATMTPLGAGYRADSAMGVVSIGVPVPNTHIRIVNDEGTEAAPREIGELRISGPQVVPGYWQMPEESSATFEGGELRTGDIGFMDEDGWVYLVDRAKDMIVASGFKVWPSEVEEVLYQHAAVREAGVVGVPDPYRGENVKAYVSLHPGAEVSPDEIKAFARERMAAYKYPRVVEILDDLPKTTSGKIMRRMLQDLARGEVVDVAPQQPASGVSFPEVRAAIEARTVLQIGATWLRLSAAGISPREAAGLYERLQALLATVDAGQRTPDRAAFLAANEDFHAAVVGVLGNDLLSNAYRSLGLDAILGRALESHEVLPEAFAVQQERLVDAIAAGSGTGACREILRWAETSRDTLRPATEATGAGVQSVRVRRSEAPVADSQASAQMPREVERLMAALEARAALEIGIIQVLSRAQADTAERSRFVARLKAAIPLVRGTDGVHTVRYVQSDAEFHDVLLGVLDNEKITDVAEAFGVQGLLLCVLEGTSISVRDALDDHLALTNALEAGDGDAASRAMAAQLPQVRDALTRVIAEFHASRRRSEA